MLIEFTTGNFRSFRGKVTFSMLAGKGKELNENIFKAPSKKVDHLIKSAVVYGANASGKSNLVHALWHFWHMLIYSAEQPNRIKDTIPFMLDDSKIKSPSFFEMVFIIKDVTYKYGFETTDQAIQSEWLYEYKTAKPTELFSRSRDKIKVNPSFKEGVKRSEFVTNDSLFLSLLKRLNGELGTKIHNWFKEEFFIVKGGEKLYEAINSTFSYFEKNAESQQKVVDFMRAIDPTIIDITFKEAPVGQLPKGFYVISKRGAPMEILFKRKKYDEKLKLNGIQNLNFYLESDGTQKMFILCGMVLNMLEKGGVIVIDELDARLHPFLTKFVVNLFHDKGKNPKNAQLVFNTHDVSLLKGKNWRRDQIWFTEKNELGDTDLYSLTEFSERTDASYDKNYLAGKYGATPSIIEAAFDLFKKE